MVHNRYENPERSIFWSRTRFYRCCCNIRTFEKIYSKTYTRCFLCVRVFFIAIGILYVRLIGKLNSPSQLFFYYFYIATILTGIVAVFQWETPTSLHQWILIAGISLSGLCYQVAVTYSYLKAPVRLMSQLVFMQTVFGGIMDWIIWKKHSGYINNNRGPASNYGRSDNNLFRDEPYSKKNNQKINL